MRIKWLDRWFMRMSKHAWEMAQADGAVRKPREWHFGPPTINMLIHKADGGYAVEIVKYDINTDHTRRNLYVFTDDTKLGDGLAQIITMNALKNS